MIRRPPRSTLSSSSAASDVYKRQALGRARLQRLQGKPLVELARARDRGGGEAATAARRRVTHHTARTMRRTAVLLALSAQASADTTTCIDASGKSGPCSPSRQFCGQPFPKDSSPAYHLMDQHGCGENDVRILYGSAIVCLTSSRDLKFCCCSPTVLFLILCTE